VAVGIFVGFWIWAWVGYDITTLFIADWLEI
jgi:hypothetical protein